MDTLRDLIQQATQPQQSAAEPQAQAAPQVGPQVMVATEHGVNPFAKVAQPKAVKTVDAQGNPITKFVDPQMGATYPAPPGKETSTETHKETMDVTRKLAEELSNDIKSKGLEKYSPWDVMHQTMNYKHNMLASILGRVPYLKDEVSAWGGPAGDVNPDFKDYYSKIGQVKGKLMKAYLGGRISEWATSFVQDHFPNEMNTPKANLDRLDGLLKGGLLDKMLLVAKENGSDELSPSDRKAIEHYVQSGMSEDAAFKKRMDDKVLHSGSLDMVEVGKF